VELFILSQKSHRLGEDFSWREVVCVYDLIRAGAGMLQPDLLLVELRQRPIQLPAGNCYFIRNVKEYEQIRFGDFLPHIWNVRMFLGDGPGVDAMLQQGSSQRCFSSPTCPGDRNQKISGRLHITGTGQVLAT